ncbi:hypothetical protein BJ322DRAFT_560748 [Thelephora terrestris]|uniref:Uncharacterized protein n=1 Tax=Thelephora terrestris TaxID=56493 RepID=A0A9P6HLR3_9AGAM|nr:hypothetical protein BJ322DRAFT_560748 [Thelephora terrestris]
MSLSLQRTRWARSLALTRTVWYFGLLWYLSSQKCRPQVNSSRAVRGDRQVPQRSPLILRHTVALEFWLLILSPLSRSLIESITQYVRCL